MRSKPAALVAIPIATWFGCGASPFAPGTAGSLGALIPAYLLVRYGGWHAPWFAVLAAFFLIPGIWAADWVAEGAKHEDPGMVVIDEVLGQWITLAGALAFNWKSWLAAFLLFRLFDIWKPFPIRRLESLPGGVGIVADDVLAGIYGALVLFALGWFNLY
jgi:phosphatidylglycerophosphatase A